MMPLVAVAVLLVASFPASLEEASPKAMDISNNRHVMMNPIV